MTVKYLTRRQHDLIDRIAAGDTVIVAAKRLGISVSTARSHLREIALRLPNPHGQTPLRLIREYCEARRLVQARPLSPPQLTSQLRRR